MNCTRTRSSWSLRGLTLIRSILNFADPTTAIVTVATPSSKQRLIASITHHWFHIFQFEMYKTSRWIIRAAWLHVLPRLDLRSIYQVVCLGSSPLPAERWEDSSWERLRA